MSLSIVVPCRDRQESLTELLRSIDQQAKSVLRGVEAIVIDDGSITPLTLERYCHLSVRLLRHDRSAGAPASRRDGLSVTRGAIVHFHDSDDLIGDGWLSRIICAFEKDPALEVLITSRAVQSERNGSLRMVHPRIVHRLIGNMPAFRHYQRFQNAIGPLGGVTFVRSAIREDDIVEAPASQDWLMYDHVIGRVSRVGVRSDIHFTQRTFSENRLTASPWKRVKGFVFASRARFTSKGQRRIAALLYCATAGEAVASVVRVRFPRSLRVACRFIAKRIAWAQAVGFDSSALRRPSISTEGSEA